METRVGDDCLFMIGSHVAHDCVIGDHVIMANNATLGGHVEVDDYAIIGGLAAVHQFVRIGAHSMVGGMSGLEQDLIPYGIAMGERARLRGLNLVGLERRDFSREAIHTLRTAYRLMFAPEGTLSERIDDVVGLYGNNSAVMEVVDFIRADVAIHPTAIVASGANFGADVQIGPYCIVSSEVSLAEGVRLHAHVVVDGRTTIGAGSVVYPFASIGTPPQDLKYRGEASQLIVGAMDD